MRPLLRPLLPLAEALSAADGTRPVQIGAHVARPFAGDLWRLIGHAYSGSGTRIRADENTGALLSGAQVRVETWAALKRLLGDDGAGKSLGATHSALDGGWPVLVCAILAAPLWLEISHPRSNRTSKCPRPSHPPLAHA